MGRYTIGKKKKTINFLELTCRKYCIQYKLLVEKRFKISQGSYCVQKAVVYSCKGWINVKDMYVSLEYNCLSL